MTLTLKGGDLVATVQESLNALSALVSTRNVTLEGDEGGVWAEYEHGLTRRIVVNR